MRFASIQCRKNATATGSLLRTPLGSLQRFSRSLADVKGAARKERERRGRKGNKAGEG